MIALYIYSSYPVGRGGGLSPRISGLDFGLFEFKFPNFHSGVIEFRVDPRSVVVNDVSIVNIFAMFCIAILGLFYRQRS